MPLIKNNTYQCEITGYTSEGLGVAKVDGAVVFINNAVKGDIANIKIVKTTKNISYGIISELLTPSPNRVHPLCSVSQKCGGCTTWHMSYEEELEFKREKVENVIKRIGKVDFDVTEIVGSSLVSRYRNKAQFPVSDVNGKAIYGFYRKNSHDIIETKDCLIQTEKSNEIAKYITDFLNKHNIQAYNEHTHSGFIRNIYIRTGFKTGEILLCLVSTSFSIPEINLLAEELRSKFKKITGFLINKNSEKTNQILGSEYITIFGEPSLSDFLCDNKFNISPSSFYQVNRQAAENLYNKAIEYCNFDGTETVLDMYCGVGTITLAVSKYVKQITGIEIVADAIKNAIKNAETNNISNATFVVGDAKDAVKRFESDKIDVVIVDPPRKGLDVDTIQSIITINPEKIAYISCDPATLARDVKIFCENGYSLRNISAFDLFPRTWHVETVILMTKA